MIFADTDVLINFLGGLPPAADHVTGELVRNNLATTAITRFELLSGARGQRELHETQRLLDTIHNAPLSNAAADRAAEIRRDLLRAGNEIGMVDSLIAGIVLTAGGSLMTRSQRHFERIKALPLVERT